MVGLGAGSVRERNEFFYDFNPKNQDVDAKFLRALKSSPNLSTTVENYKIELVRRGDLYVFIWDNRCAPQDPKKCPLQAPGYFHSCYQGEGLADSVKAFYWARDKLRGKNGRQ